MMSSKKSSPFPIADSNKSWTFPGFSTLKLRTNMIQSPTITAMMNPGNYDRLFYRYSAEYRDRKTPSRSSALLTESLLNVPYRSLPFVLFILILEYFLECPLKVMLILRSHFFFVNIFSFCRLYSKKPFFYLFSLSSFYFSFISLAVFTSIFWHFF